jgi:deoxycytidine triphosphate deaminase
MVVLSRKDIMARLADIFEAKTYDANSVDRAAYNLRLDDQEMILNGELYYHGENTYPYAQHHGKIVLPARKISILTTIEKFHLPLDLVARGGISLRLANKGLIGFFGPQIDPGYRGRFIAVVWNSGSHDIELDKENHIVKIEFHALSTPSKEGFRKPKDIKEMERFITEKSLLEDVEVKLALMESGLNNTKATLDKQRIEISEIKEGYRSTVLFGIFLVASAVIGVVLTQLIEQANQLSEIIGSRPLAIIVLLYFISIPILSGIIIYFVVRKTGLTREKDHVD